jgi:hypothetical protein
MSDRPQTAPMHSFDSAFDQGRRNGLATAALALSVVSFVNLLGIEKSILAAVLGMVALQGAEPIRSLLRRGRIAIALAAVHASTVVVVLIVFRDKLGQLLTHLQSLS